MNQRAVVIVLVVIAGLTAWAALASMGRSPGEFSRDPKKDRKLEAENIKDKVGAWTPDWFSVPQVRADEMHFTCEPMSFGGTCGLCVENDGWLPRKSSLFVGSGRVVFDSNEIATFNAFDSIERCRELREEAVGLSSPSCTKSDCPGVPDDGENEIPLQVPRGGGLVLMRCEGTCSVQQKPDA